MKITSIIKFFGGDFDDLINIYVVDEANIFSEYEIDRMKEIIEKIQKKWKIIEKKSKYGKVFYGCNKYPNCDYALWNEPTGNVCPECGELLVKKVSKNGTFEVCSNRTCNYKKSLEEISNEKID